MIEKGKGPLELAERNDDEPKACRAGAAYALVMMHVYEYHDKKEPSLFSGRLSLWICVGDGQQISVYHCKCVQSIRSVW